jgi:HK97 family phage portal protein
MGLFDRLFGNRPKPAGRYEGQFKLLNGYTPRFTSWNGSIYESDLIRAAINARATHISKLEIRIDGTAKPALRRKLSYNPNEFQTWSQFLYRLSTILDVHNSAFIVPIYDQYGEPSGIYAPLPDSCEFVQYGGRIYMRYKFHWGEYAAIEMENCGIMTKYQYRDDFLGESNAALIPTIDMINMQNQGIKEGVKSAATYRFMAKVSNFSKAADLAKERKRFTSENFGREAQADGILLFPNTYSDIRQVEAKPFVIDADQMQAIKDNVYQYFGVNEDILTNHFNSETWGAFYEGAVEPWAIQFSQVMTKMLFTMREAATGSRVVAMANRLQYMSNTDKLNVSSQMADRGLMTRNEVREIWDLPPLPSPYGDQLPIRGEYYNLSEKTEVTEDENT